MDSDRTFTRESNLRRLLHDMRFPGGIAASGPSSAFGGLLFTRDSCRMLLDTLHLYPAMAREVLGLLPQTQGARLDAATEEQPDRMAHVTFREVVAGRTMAAERIADARRWARRWGVPYRRGYTVYNSTDGAPLYLITLAAYCDRWGSDILGDRFRHRPSGGWRTVADAGARCAGWITRRIQASERAGVGLLEAANTNPRQTSWSAVMRDGFHAYFHPVGGGVPVARSRPIAYLEAQALAYDALRAAARLLPGHRDRGLWEDVAGRLPGRTVEHMWLADDGFFAAALDRDDAGRPRPVRLRSSAAFELLDSGLLEPLAQRRAIVEALVERLYSPAFMTAVGPRMRSLRQARYEGDFYAYQGSGTVWGVTNGIICRGLERFGLHPLADDLGRRRFLAGLDATGAAVEMWFVERDTGAVVWNPRLPEPARHIAASSLPQPDQGWTASAALRLMTAAQPGRGPSDAWAAAVCRRALGTRLDLSAADEPPREPLAVDRERGRELAARKRRLVAA
jgi:glycogen debranching enzyme